MSKGPVEKWKILESQEIFRSPFHRFRVDRCEMPGGKIMPNYYIMEFPDWVNVLALTPSEEVLLVKQYRHAANEITIELPGGTTDPHSGEDAATAARRELIEETGYVPAKIEYVGFHVPNPAFQTNKIHLYLATGCELKQAQELDPYEHIEVLKASLTDVEELIRSGQFTHSCMIASFYRAKERYLLPF